MFDIIIDYFVILAALYSYHNAKEVKAAIKSFFG